MAYMDKAIDSVLVCRDDVEIIIVNDGSKDETDRIGKEYAEKYLASEYPGVSLDTLYRKSDLNSLAETLKNDEKIYVLHSINDFLLSENDRKFLDSTLENRITWTSRGGHLGNLYYEKVQQKILKMLE